MNLDELKDALGDEKHKALVAFVGDLTGQRDTARKESIEGRKSLKSQVEKLTTLNKKAFERLGVESEEELDELPEQKGQAEAVKQLGAKVKRLERELGEANTARETLAQARTKDRRDALIAQAVAKHGFVNAEDAATLLGARLKTEGEEFMFETEGGKLVPLDEGVAWFAKSRPNLVKAQGGPGSGYREGGDKGGQKTMKRADFEQLPPADRAAVMKEKTVLTD